MTVERGWTQSIMSAKIITKRKRSNYRASLGLWGKIVSYHLQTNVYALIGLFTIGVISVWTYYFFHQDNGFTANLWLAIATSIMASFLLLLSETYVKYKSHQNDLFLEGITKLGIANLHFDRRELLADMIDQCEKELWICGYRYHLNAELALQISNCAKRGTAIRMLIVPPWLEAFKLVYGDKERITDNYITVLNMIDDALPTAQTKDSIDLSQIEVRFVNKPLFSDTYKADHAIITGPYMHNTDPLYGRLFAGDFFTYELHQRSLLYDRVLEEYEALWSEADMVLDWEIYSHKVRERLRNCDFNDGEKQNELKRCLKTIEK